MSLQIIACAALASLAALASACGKSGSFKNKGNERVQETPRPTPVPLPKVENVEVRGYGDPDIQGQDIKFIADGKTRPLGDPSDTQENPTVTIIINGTSTIIRSVSSAVTDLTNDATCPGGQRLKDTCIQFSPVYKWNREGSSDESRLLLSHLNEGCDSASEPCKSLRSASLNYRTYNKIAFHGIAESSAKTASIADSFKSITFCHASIGTTAPESVLTGSAACASSKETFYGFAASQGGTVPVFVWKKDGYAILSLEEAKAPADGFVRESAGPIFYAFAPN